MLILAACLVLASVHESGSARAFVGARLLPISSDEIDDGTLLVQDGRIVAVGPRSEVEIPPGTEVVDVTGRVVMPGLVDTHSHIGAPSGGDRSGPLQPEARVLDSIDVLHPSLMRARAGGITTANVMPGSGHLSSGQTVYLKLARGNTIEELAIRGPEGGIAGGLKMANGTNPQGAAPFPGTRARAAALVRQRFIDAEEYRAARQRAQAEGKPGPARDLALEALLEALDGRRIVHHHTHRHDDVMTVLRLADEFGLRVVLHHVSDAWKVADQIAAAGVPCSIIVIDSPGGKLEARDLLMGNGTALERAGVEVAFHTDDPITDSRLFLRSPALAVRSGMSRRAALRGVTLAAAGMLDLADRIGSLEPGKDADFIVLDGDPLSVYTHVLETWVEGQRVFDLSDPEDRLYAVGGWGAGAPEEGLGGCCAPEVGAASRRGQVR